MVRTVRLFADHGCEWPLWFSPADFHDGEVAEAELLIPDELAGRMRRWCAFFDERLVIGPGGDVDWLSEGDEQHFLIEGYRIAVLLQEVFGDGIRVVPAHDGFNEPGIEELAAR